MESTAELSLRIFQVEAQKNGRHTKIFQCVYEVNLEDLRILFLFSVLASRNRAKQELFSLKQIKL